MAPLIRERQDTRPGGALPHRKRMQHEAIERLIAVLDPLGTDSYQQMEGDLARLARLRAARARYVLRSSDGVLNARKMKRGFPR